MDGRKTRQSTGSVASSHGVWERQSPKSQRNRRLPEPVKEDVISNLFFLVQAYKKMGNEAALSSLGEL